MLMFGYISDKLGRKLGMFFTTVSSHRAQLKKAIIFVFMILMACSAGPTPQVLINCLIAFRFFVGKYLCGVSDCRNWYRWRIPLWIMHCCRSHREHGR